MTGHSLAVWTRKYARSFGKAPPAVRSEVAYGKHEAGLYGAKGNVVSLKRAQSLLDTLEASPAATS
jgi:hypothetical protein